MRICPPTAGMRPWRFLARVLLITVWYKIARTLCMIFGHRRGEMVVINNHRWQYCERCEKELFYSDDREKVEAHE